MNKKYIKYINYIVNDIEPPYFKNMEDQYGASENEYEFVLSKIFNQPVTVKDGDYVYDQNGNEIYYEFVNGEWEKREFDQNNNLIHYEDSYGYWVKKEYDEQGNQIYFVDSDGSWVKKEYDENNSLNYFEDSEEGVIIDNR